MSSDEAWIAVKPCGCVTFARLVGVIRAPLPDNRYTIRRVPVEQARVVICRCRR